MELIRIDGKTAAHIGTRCEQGWLSRYPQPMRCIHDNGGEFTGEHFQLRLQTNGIKDVPTTVKNPQANSICERMHQTVANSLRSMIHTNPPNNMEEAYAMIDACLALAMRAQRTAIQTGLRLSPGAFVFQRDMLLDIPLIANMELIRERKQHLINEQLRRHNARRISYDYLVNDQKSVARHPAVSSIRVRMRASLRFLGLESPSLSRHVGGIQGGSTSDSGGASGIVTGGWRASSSNLWAASVKRVAIIVALCPRSISLLAKCLATDI
eukprot:scaffold87600_cov35-Attheya_sp.AAC.1